MHLRTLKTLLDEVGHRPIVVVTDRYPPNSYGGAELSLHLLLRAMATPGQVLVVTFEDRLVAPRRYEVDELQVIALPRQAPWPFHRMTHAEYSRLETKHGWSDEPRRLQAVRKAVHDDPGLNPVIRAQALRLLERKPPRGGVVADFLEYSSGLAATYLRQLFQLTDPRVIHADNYRSILLTAVATSRSNAKMVATVRDNRFHCVRYNQSVLVRSGPCVPCNLACAREDSPSGWEDHRQMLEQSQAFRKQCLDQYDKVIVTSNYLHRSTGAIVATERLRRVPNSPEQANDAARSMRGVAELPGINLLIVGILNENKGQLEFTKRLPELLRKVPGVFVHFAGRGPRIEAAIKNVAERGGFLDRLIFHGYVSRERLYELYRECQIVVLPTSWPEPFGRVPLEAGLARRPVVAFAVGGLTESIVDDKTGFLIEPGDFTGLFDAIYQLALQPELRMKLGENASLHVAATYNSDECKKLLIDVWLELVANANEASGLREAMLRARGTNGPSSPDSQSLAAPGRTRVPGFHALVVPAPEVPRVLLVIESLLIRAFASERKARKYARDRVSFFADSRNSLVRLWFRLVTPAHTQAVKRS